MNPISQILWEAAADVEQNGVTEPPVGKTATCAFVAIADAVTVDMLGKGFWESAEDVLRVVTGEPCIQKWNDAQPSRAVVAAAMRDAAQLAEWAGPWLLGGSK